MDPLLYVILSTPGYLKMIVYQSIREGIGTYAGVLRNEVCPLHAELMGVKEADGIGHNVCSQEGTIPLLIP